jgi:hypothetical protein
MKARDSQVRALAAYLEMEGYDRSPFNDRQLQSFNRQVKERLDQETEAANQVMVRESPVHTKFGKMQLCTIDLVLTVRKLNLKLTPGPIHVV